jgi:nuclear RNA export factor
VFDVNEDAQMPTSKGSFSGAEEGLPFVCQFLEQYYQIYDSDKREQLVCAYHDNAMFSMTSAYPPTRSSTSTNK